MLNAEQLTEALRRSGALTFGRVREVAVDGTRKTVLSEIVRLRLAYAGDAAAAPATVIVKTSLPERTAPTWTSGRDEVAFYTQVAAAMPPGLVPRCFDAQWQQESNTWHLVLEDLTDSHYIASVWPAPPSLVECKELIEGRARFHAAWWDDARLGVSVGERLDTAAIGAQFQKFFERYERFRDFMGDRLSATRRDLYERLLDAAPRLVSRYTSRRNLTIVQGDAHVWNSFLPRDPASHDVRLFDWDCWRIDVACDDLAYMMAVHWYPELRSRFERPLLDRYHETLVAHGVEGYDRRALADDYRLSALWQIMTPVWQAALNIPPNIWWNNFERIMLAVDDLGCRELLT